LFRRYSFTTALLLFDFIRRCSKQDLNPGWSDLLCFLQPITCIRVFFFIYVEGIPGWFPIFSAEDNNADQTESLETMFWVKILKFLDADLGWKKFGSEINIRIRNPVLNYVNVKPESGLVCKVLLILLTVGGQMVPLLGHLLEAGRQLIPLLGHLLQAGLHLLHLLAAPSTAYNSSLLYVRSAPLCTLTFPVDFQ
jgi:hypothetical protein